MKVQILGTAAAEGFPALFCNCDACKRAFEKGGRNLRTRSGVIVDDHCMIDYSCDTLMHMYQNHLDLAKIDTLLLSHSHEDHFYVDDFFCRTFGYTGTYDQMAHLTVAGNVACGKKLSSVDNYVQKGKMNFEVLHAGDVKLYNGIKVTACPARHDPGQECLVFILEKDGKTFFYGHDSGYYLEETWEMLKGRHLDLALLECTCGVREAGMTGGHQGFPDNIKVRERMLRENIADHSTIFCLSHFSHNGGMDYDDAVAAAVPKGFIVAYDGIVLEI